MKPHYYDKVFTDGLALDNRSKAKIKVTKTVNELNVPSGQLIICDPFTYKGNVDSALVYNISPGKYPVFISKDHHFVACIKIVLKNEPISKWEVAKQDASSKNPRNAFSVDSGTACFSDMKSMKETLLLPETDLEKKLMETIESGDEAFLANDSMFLSASFGGDGTYRCWQGLTEKDERVVLLVDFNELTFQEWKEATIALNLTRVQDPIPLKHALLDDMQLKIEQWGVWKSKPIDPKQQITIKTTIDFSKPKPDISIVDAKGNQIETKQENVSDSMANSEFITFRTDTSFPHGVQLKLEFPYKTKKI